MIVPLDASVYPDETPPTELIGSAQKADYLQRIVGAFDYGVPPEAPTIRLLSGWRDIFDAYPLLGSPGYHALRAYFGWPELPRERFASEPAYLRQDAFEGRLDGFEDCI